ncbi:MAG: 4-hydroxy-tetrahydrodipicolinate reductase [Chloroflexi bacterium]|nr:4-hydroxy-tetrahydrodipicolinate reductase [Chloroflexota bacterium]
MVKVVIIGAAGQMGRQVAYAALQDTGIQVVGAVVEPNAPEIGVDVGTLAGLGAIGVAATDDLASAIDAADAVVEFTAPRASLGHLGLAAKRGKAAVVGTTGFSATELDAIGELAGNVPVVLSPNMSVGVNVLLKILPLVTRALGTGYDVEIVEAHHRRKKDAPSGTALKLAELIAAARDQELRDIARFGREGLAPRKEGELGLHAVRGGGIVGEHHVIFVNEGEQVEIVHRALSRQTFALGAVRAAKFVAKQKPGLYSMQDVLAADLDA